MPLERDGGNSAHVPYSLESHLHDSSLDPPESYPVPVATVYEMNGSALSPNPRSLSAEEKKEHLAIARNSLEILSAILDSGAEPKLLKVNFLMLKECAIL